MATFTKINSQNVITSIHAFNIKQFVAGRFASLKQWFNKPSKKQLIENEIARKMQTINFKFIGGLSVLEQLEIIKLRANGLTQNAIAEKMATSRGTVIRTLKQKSKVIYISECFNRLYNV